MRRDCSTCQKADDGKCRIWHDFFGNCIVTGFTSYSPRPYWTEAERAGLKAMGELYRNAAKLRETIATIIYAYVDAARRVKDGGR